MLRIVNITGMWYNYNVMKRFTLVILAFFLVFTNIPVFSAQAFVKKDLSVQSSDKFNIKASLTYPKVKGKKDFKTVVLLHSLGTDSMWWSDLPDTLLQDGYAVLAIDLRGHGKSVYDSKLNKVSWKNLTVNAYKKYPDDVLSVINYINQEYPKLHFFNDWAIIGSDIGGSAGIIASDRYKNNPKKILLLSPVVHTRGLYIPVSVAQLDNVDFLSISCNTDFSAIEAQNYIKKFAQNGFTTYTSQSKGTGMIMIKNAPEVIPLIDEWIKQYLKD